MSHTIHIVSARTQELFTWVARGFSSLWHWLRGDAPAVDGEETAKLPRAERKRRRKELIAQAKATKGK
jgi:hypothetical protein